MNPRDSLGKGLKAILPDFTDDLKERPTFVMLGIEELYPNPFQARRDFSDPAQSKLVASVKRTGIIQPIVVRKTDKGYEIIAGERRWRAAQAAGLQEVPVIIKKDIEDITAAEMSLIENIEREELNPIEEAHAYQTLSERFGLSHEEIALRVGKDRSTVTNTIRLLKLPEEIKQALVKKIISEGHARALLAVESPKEQLRILRDIAKKKLTVRETERLIKKTSSPRSEEKIRDPVLESLERKIEAKLATKARILKGKKSGKIELFFNSEEELDRLIEWIIRR